MSRIITVVVLTALSFALCFCSLHETETAVQEMAEKTEQLLQLSDGDTDAERQLELFCKDWEKYEKRLAFYTRHSELEEITSTVQVLPTIWESGRSDLFAIACADVLSALEHMRDTERPRLCNIM